VSSASWSRVSPASLIPHIPRERFRLDVPACSARAGDANNEVAERVVELLDMREHAHARMVLTAGAGVHAAPRELHYCMPPPNGRVNRVGAIGAIVAALTMMFAVIGYAIAPASPSRVLSVFVHDSSQRVLEAFSSSGVSAGMDCRLISSERRTFCSFSPEPADFRGLLEALDVLNSASRLTGIAAPPCNSTGDLCT